MAMWMLGPCFMRIELKITTYAPGEFCDAARPGLAFGPLRLVACGPSSSGFAPRRCFRSEATALCMAATTTAATATTSTTAVAGGRLAKNQRPPPKTKKLPLQQRPLRAHKQSKPPVPERCERLRLAEATKKRLAATAVISARLAQQPASGPLISLIGRPTYELPPAYKPEPTPSVAQDRDVDVQEQRPSDGHKHRTIKPPHVGCGSAVGHQGNLEALASRSFVAPGAQSTVALPSSPDMCLHVDEAAGSFFDPTLDQELAELQELQAAAEAHDAQERARLLENLEFLDRRDGTRDDENTADEHEERPLAATDYGFPVARVEQPEGAAAARIAELEEALRAADQQVILRARVLRQAGPAVRSVGCCCEPSAEAEPSPALRGEHGCGETLARPPVGKDGGRPAAPTVEDFATAFLPIAGIPSAFAGAPRTQMAGKGGRLRAATDRRLSTTSSMASVDDPDDQRDQEQEQEQVEPLSDRQRRWLGSAACGAVTAPNTAEAEAITASTDAIPSRSAMAAGRLTRGTQPANNELRAAGGGAALTRAFEACKGPDRKGRSGGSIPGSSGSGSRRAAAPAAGSSAGSRVGQWAGERRTLRERQVAAAGFNDMAAKAAEKLPVKQRASTLQTEMQAQYTHTHTEQQQHIA